MMLIVIQDRFRATHAWENCPHEEVAFLRHPHRHEFHVTVKFAVEHDDRDLEFIMMKNRLSEFINDNYANRHMGKKSCEMIAREIGDHFDAHFVRVMEDGENGAEYVRRGDN